MIRPLSLGKLYNKTVISCHFFLKAMKGGRDLEAHGITRE